MLKIIFVKNKNEMKIRISWNIENIFSTSVKVKMIARLQKVELKIYMKNNGETCYGFN